MAAELWSGLFSVDGRSAAEVWDLRDRLGTGSSSVVHRAIHRRMSTSSAVKLAGGQGSQSSQSSHVARSCARAVNLLRHEREILIGLGEHDHIVRVVDFFDHSSGPPGAALVLELLPGGDCQQLLQQHGALPERTVRAMMRQLHLALAFLHGQHVLHRDVKLENILLCGRDPLVNPFVKLCDFGHALRTEEVSERLLFCGTEGYAAPEVSLPRSTRQLWTYAADVWGLGVVMCANREQPTPPLGDPSP